MQGHASPQQPLKLADAPSTAAQRGACLRLAGIFRGALEHAAAGAGGGEPGEERLRALHASLAAAGELFPKQRPGLLSADLAPSFLKDAAIEPAGSAAARRDSGDVDSLSDPAAQMGAGAQSGAPGSADTHKSAAYSPVLAWLKAGQIWMLCEAGARSELEAVCWRPGVDASQLAQLAPSGGDAPSSAADAGGARLAAALGGRGERGAAGLLLRAVGDTPGALAQWQDEFEAQRERAECLRVHAAAARPDPPNGNASAPEPEPSPARAPLDASECRTLEEHAVAHAEPAARPAAAAAARALMAAARGAEALCGTAHVAEGALSDAHVGWLLQMPSQCALGVLCSRSDLHPRDLFSPCHDVGGGDDSGLDAAELWLQARAASRLPRL